MSEPLSSTHTLSNRSTDQNSADCNIEVNPLTPSVSGDLTQPADSICVPSLQRHPPPNALGRLASLCVNLPNFIIVERIVCGRSDEADISFGRMKSYFADWYDIISKEQFVIRKSSDLEGTQAVIIDKSTNGTFVNSVRLIKNQEHELFYGDCISLGKVECLAFAFCAIHESGPVHSLSSKYILLPVLLGKGGYGKVSLCRAESDIQQKFAVKQLNKKQLGSFTRHACTAEMIKLERDLLLATKHPNIMRCYDFFEHNDIAYLVLEYCSGGEFYEFIVDEKWKGLGLGDYIGRFYAYQLLIGLTYLHTNNICHRDIKPENILLMAKGDFVLAKLTDFGLARRFDLDTMKSNVGTEMYQAPEVCSKYADERFPYKNKVDIWSLGCVLFTAFVGYPPFSPDFDDMPAKEQIQKGRLKFLHHWKFISAETQSSIAKMLSVQPGIRPSAIELLQLPWMDPSKNMSVRKARELVQKNVITVS